MKNKKNNLEVFLSSRTGKRFFNIFYSWGAAIVIIGAMCKLVHFPIGDIMLVIGMVVEALVFILSGLDNSDIDDDRDVDTNQYFATGGLVGSKVEGTVQTDNYLSSKETSKNKTSASSSSPNPIVIISGNNAGNVPSSGNNNISPEFINKSGVTNPVTTTNIGTGTNNAPLSGSDNREYIQPQGNTINTNNAASDYSSASRNMENFSQTMLSLNEMSQEILNAYKQVGDNQNLANNLTDLNKNIAGLNDLFSSLSEQINSVRYINDSLNRMKNLYDGAIGDGYMFKEESAKMTKHIEALNNVYARLLQAMNSNNNHNPSTF